MCLMLMAAKSGDNGIGPSFIGLSAPSFLTVKNSPIYSGIIELEYNHTPLPITSGGTGLTSIGSEGQVLSIISSSPTPQLGWISVTGTGTVTSVSLSLPPFLKSSTSTITSSGIFDISYSDTPIPISSGGTGLTSLGLNGQILSTNGIEYTWVEPSHGTVSSVGLSLPSFLQSSTSSITSSGQFDISYSKEPLPITSGGTGLVSIGPKGQLLSSDGDQYTWVEQTKGTVTSVSLSLPSFLKTSTSTITSKGLFDISYSDVPIPVSSGGTGLSSIGSKNQILISDGTSFTWKDPSAASVYSVGLNTELAPFLSVSNTPVTSAGTLSLFYTPDIALPITSGGTGLTVIGLKDQILTSDGLHTTWAYPKEINCIKSIKAVLPLSCTSGENPEISIASSTGFSSIVLSNSPTITSPTLITPNIGNAIASSLTIGGISISASSGNYGFILPTAIGRTGQILTSQGLGKPLTWTSPSALPSDSILVQDTTITTLKPMIQKNGNNSINSDFVFTSETFFQFQTISQLETVTLTSPSAQSISLAINDSSPGTTFTGIIKNPFNAEIIWVGGQDITILDARPTTTIAVQLYILEMVDDQTVTLLLK